MTELTPKIKISLTGQEIPLLPEKLSKWGIKYSIWPTHLVTACCGVEFAQTSAPGYDAERWGFLPFLGPRQTNAIVIEGTLSLKMAKIARVVYDQMPSPKFVIAMGSCAMEGGVFWNSYHVAKAENVLPIDAYVMGCPPTPEAVIRAIRMVQDKIEKGKMKPSMTPNKVDLSSLPKSPKPQNPPSPPHRREEAKDINTCKPMPNLQWPQGIELAGKLKDAGVNALPQAMNRICASTDSNNIVNAIEAAFKVGFDHVKSINVIDLPIKGVFRIEYVLGSYSKELAAILLTISTEVPRNNPKVPTIIDIYPGADYQEREMHELFGVWFEGNPWMGRNFMLSPDTPVKYPLRKDYEVPSLARVIVER
jgi:NADH dehydrogenase subunit B (EC 1.6.5.3)/NADH dehydrogenase subunit C (EC 1.6.5.3)